MGNSCQQSGTRTVYVGLRTDRMQVGRRSGSPKKKDRADTSGVKVPARKRKRARRKKPGR